MLYLDKHYLKLVLYKKLLEKIHNKNSNICIIGLGQVGLPTALTFANIGYKVTGYDINELIIQSLSQKKSLFEEDGIEELLSRTIDNKTFAPSSSLNESVEGSDVIIVCVATPTTEDVRPNLSFLQNALNSLSEFDLSEKLVIVESSIPPGTFENLIIPIITKNVLLGKNFWAAYVPERLSPSQAFSEIQKTPRIIGHEDSESGVLAKSLYEKFVKSKILLTTSRSAELSKLVENTFRDVNIALANEISLICEKYNVDFGDLIRICNSHPRVNLHMAGPGVGGPCLPKDPYLLLNPANGDPIKSKIISESRKINDLMPLHVSNLTTKALEKQNKILSKSTILILGTSYKGNVSDTRFSPSKDLIHDLLQKQCRVLVYDPYTDESFNAEKLNTLDDSILSKCDAVVVISDHNEFKKIDPHFFQSMIEKPIIVDTKRIFNSSDIENLNMIYISVGYLGLSFSKENQ